MIRSIESYTDGSPQTRNAPTPSGPSSAATASPMSCARAWCQSPTAPSYPALSSDAERSRGGSGMSTTRYPGRVTCRARISSRAAFRPDLASPLSMRKNTSALLSARTAWTVTWSGWPGPMPMTRSSRIPLLVLRRPEWDADPAWEAVADIRVAAVSVRDWPGDSVFLTTGRRDLAAFAADDGHGFLVRTVDPPDGPVPARMTLIMDRGPATVAGEAALRREPGVGLLVTKNSGGPMTAAKLRAARDLGVRGVLGQRPPLPEGSIVVATVPEAVRCAGRQGTGSISE